MAILDAYPHCQIAVAWCELFASPSDLDDQDCFAEMRQAGLSLPEALTVIRDAMQDIANDPECEGKHASAMAQTEHPTFMVYLAGKLGMA